MSGLAEEMLIPRHNINVLDNVNALGSGGFGYVTRGQLKTQTEQSISVAIKYPCDRKTLNKLIAEAVSMWNLRGHPNCVLIYGLLLEQDSLGLVMEYMDCGSLSQLVGNDDIAYQAGHFTSWMWQLANAVDYFHSRNTLHRDLKLENILLSDGYRVLKVGDFGEFTPERDTMQSLHGTVDTIAPEVFKGDIYTKKRDIFSIGIIMYQLISRKRSQAVYGNASYYEVMYRVAAYGKRPPRITCHILLSEFYERCWHQDPESRPDSSQVLDYFAKLLRRYPADDRPLLTTVTREDANILSKLTTLISNSGKTFDSNSEKNRKVDSTRTSVSLSDIEVIPYIREFDPSYARLPPLPKDQTICSRLVARYPNPYPGGSADMYVIQPTDEEIMAKRMRLTYNVVKDEYKRGDETVRGFASWTYDEENMLRRVDYDHQMAYLSRREDTPKGEITWIVDLTTVIAQSLTVEGMAGTTFQDGEFTSYIKSIAKKWQFPRSGNITLDNPLPTIYKIVAKFSGEKGTHAYEYAQLFRTRIENTVDDQLVIEVKFD